MGAGIECGLLRRCRKTFNGYTPLTIHHLRSGGHPVHQVGTARDFVAVRKYIAENDGQYLSHWLTQSLLSLPHFRFSREHFFAASLFHTTRLHYPHILLYKTQLDRDSYQDVHHEALNRWFLSRRHQTQQSAPVRFQCRSW